MRDRFILAMAVGSLLLTACGAGDTTPDDGPAATEDAGTDSATATDGTADEEATGDAREQEPRVERDLVFMTRKDDRATLALDMHFPDDPSGAPILIGWGDTIPVITSLVDDGVLVVEIAEDNHLVREDDPDGPEELIDLGVPRPESYECALRYVRVRASELGNDDPTVVLTGFSVTAAEATHVGLLSDTLTQRWDEYETAGGAPREFDCEETGGSTHVDVVIGQGGPYGVHVPIIDGPYGRAYQQERNPRMQEFLASAIGTNPDLRLRLIHGMSDFIPLDLVEEFAEAMRLAGYDVEVITFPGGHTMAPTRLFRSTLLDVLAP